MSTPAPIADTDLPSILALNNQFAAELSLLDADALRILVRHAFYATRIGRVDAFLIALDQSHPAYQSPNYLWFRARHASFVYVDRVVTAPAARGRGHARLLYAGLVDAARAAGQDRVACEVNLEPANPASDAFHAALGFREVGRATIHGGAKTVRYLELPIGPAPAAALPDPASRR